MPLLLEGKTFLAPEGSLTLVRLASGLCPMTVAKFPEARARRPRSPIFSSKLHTMVPSGMLPTGITFPEKKQINYKLCKQSNVRDTVTFNLKKVTDDGVAKNQAYFGESMF